MTKKTQITKILNALLAGDILLTILCSVCFDAAFFYGLLKPYPGMEAILYLSGIIVLMVSLLLLASFAVCCFAKIKVRRLTLPAALTASVIVFIEMLLMTAVHLV